MIRKKYLFSREPILFPVQGSQENNIKGIPECPLNIIEPTDVFAQLASHQQRISLLHPFKRQSPTVVTGLF